MTRYAVVVDPLSTGQEYAAAFRAAGMAPIGVLSGPEPVPVHRGQWHPEEFDHVHHFDGDVGALAAALRAHRPECLIPGAETGVELYEALVPLVLPGTGNVPELAAARRDKWAMARAVAAAGIPHLRQFCSDDPAAIQAWLDREGLADRPLVVKPPKGAGTVDVHGIEPGGDWRAVLDRIVGRVNSTGVRNDALLVQEYAPGREYLVDSYSVDGRHGLVDVCRYTKVSRGNRIGIYDRVDFLDPDDPDVAGVWSYTRRVLDAVGVRNGCGHTEVMLTPDGPRLIEIAERPAGGGHQLISMLATGDNHIRRTVDHRVHGRFTPGYRLLRHVRGIVVSAPRAGVWRNAEIFDDVDTLPTFHAKHFPTGSGARVPETVDLNTYLGWVILMGPDPDAIEADYRRIKDVERRIVLADAG